MINPSDLIPYVAMGHHAASLYAAARDLASNPQAQFDEGAQARICAKHGIFLDQMTDDEFKHLESLTQDFYAGGR